MLSAVIFLINIFWKEIFGAWPYTPAPVNPPAVGITTYYEKQQNVDTTNDPQRYDGTKYEQNTNCRPPTWQCIPCM